MCTHKQPTRQQGPAAVQISNSWRNSRRKNYHCYRILIEKIGEDPLYFIGMNSNFNKDKDLKNGKLWDLEAKKRFMKECISH